MQCEHQENRQTSTNLDYSAKAELIAGECLKNYNAGLVKKISKGLQNKSLTTILEFGAGLGTLAMEYLRQNKIKPDCIEIDPEQILIIKNKGLACFHSVKELQKKYDAIYTSNVLEHIEDDSATLNELHECLNPRGRIAIYVPAFMCIWNQLDEVAGHYRRYSKKELCQKVSLAGFNILSCQYLDSVGFFAWFHLRFKGYKKGDIAGHHQRLKFFDLFLYPLSEALDFLGCRYFFGKNLLLIAEKN